MKKPSAEILIVSVGAAVGIALAVAGLGNGLRFAAPYETKEIAAVSAQVQALDEEAEGLELKKTELQSSIEKLKKEESELEKSMDEKKALYDEASLELNDLEEYQLALYNLEEYIRPLKLVADMTVYWGYDFERAGELSSDTNLMNSINGMFGNIVTDLFVKGANDSKNKILDVVGQFNNAVEPYVNSNLKLIEDAKAIVYEIEFCSRILEAPDDQNELLMNLRLMKKHFGGVPSPEFYKERIKALMPGLYQGYKQFKLIEGAYGMAFQSADSYAIKNMRNASYNYEQAIDAYTETFDQDWYDQCMEVAEENYSPIVAAYKTLIDSCLDSQDEMKELYHKVFPVTNVEYGDCEISVFYKVIDSKAIILCMEDRRTMDGRMLGKFYYDYNGWPIYFYSYLDGREFQFNSDGADRFMDGKKALDGTPEGELASIYYGKASYLRHLIINNKNNKEELLNWYHNDRFNMD